MGYDWNMNGLFVGTPQETFIGPTLLLVAVAARGRIHP